MTGCIEVVERTGQRSQPYQSPQEFHARRIGSRGAAEQLSSIHHSRPLPTFTQGSVVAKSTKALGMRP